MVKPVEKQADAQLAIRVPARDKELIAEAAKKENRSMSNFILTAALKRAQEVVDGK